MQSSKARLALSLAVLGAPGAVEVGLCTVVVVSCFLWLPDFWLGGVSFKQLSIPGVITVALFVASIRHQWDPVFSRVYATAGTLWTLLWIATMFVVGWNSPIRGWVWAVWLPASLVVIFVSMVTGIRNRRGAIPALLMTLKARDYRMRRKAAAALFRIAHYDPPGRRKHCNDWLGRWFHRGSMQRLAIEAAPALQNALRDKDEVVRFLAVKALNQIYSVRDKGPSEE